MKKADPQHQDDLRPQYHRSDFGELVRGKYAARLIEETNVVVLDPEVAEAFPNDEAVNKALKALIAVAKATTRPAPRSTRAGKKPPAD